MDPRITLSRAPSKPTSGSVASELLKVTITVAGEGRRGWWLKVTGALFSFATFASLGIAYILYRSKKHGIVRPSSPRRHTPELESNWRTIFAALGQLAQASSVPLGVVPRFSSNTFRGTFYPF
jgi:hypothetical protein